jgi:hypothetical protein
MGECSEMGELRVNEQILMKLAEAEKKRNFKQTLKDNAWTIGLSAFNAPSVGFAIDQQRRNIKKEKATGETPKTLIERLPGTVSGAVAGGLIYPLARMAGRGIAGAQTSPAQLKSEMIGGAIRGALSGLMFVDPLTLWGTRKYYQRRDEEMERAIRNRIQEGSLQKEAAYGDTVKALGRKAFKAAGDTAFRNLLQSKTKGDLRRAILQINAIHAANKFVQENAKGITTGALIAGTSGALGGARALITRQREREKTASYYAVREMLGLDKEVSQAASAALQKEAAYGDAVKALGKKILGAAEDAAINKFLQSKTSEEFRRAGLRADAIRAANRFVQENAKGITTGALIAGTSGALAGARALITRQREREKTASYYVVREMLGLDKEASQAPGGTQQEIGKRRRHQALEDAILENPKVKFRDLPPLQQVGTMVGGYYGAKKLRAMRRGNTWSPAVDAILGAGIGASVGNLLGAIATDAAIRHEEKASQKRK